MKLFYALLLWATRFELAVAKAAPARNYANIAKLQRDESEYEGSIVRIECGL